MPHDDELLARAEELGIRGPDALGEDDLLELIRHSEEARVVQGEQLVAEPAAIRIQLMGIRGRFELEDDDIPVRYILTSASLTRERPEEEGTGMRQHREHMQDLLKFSTPVREILNVSELNFDELMQRDLDDYRISQEIITYLTGVPPTGYGGEVPAERLASPRFFPPILGVIVPYDPLEKCILDHYESHEEVKTEDVLLEKLSDSLKIIHIRKNPTSSLEMDSHKTKLIIVDGQHRAMAVLAAYRTAFDEWTNVTIGGENSNYLQSLYKRNEATPAMLANLDLPVCLIYFPTLTADNADLPEGMTITKAIRKLFLDVNRNAKIPSEIRRVLLDDYNMKSLCLRHLLNTIAERDDGIRIHHIDVDSDQEWEDYQPSRSLCIANVRILYELINRIFNEVNETVAAKGFADATSKNISNAARLRKMLGIDKIGPTELRDDYGHDGDGGISQEHYNRKLEPFIKEKFNSGWGNTIIQLYSDFYPYKKRNLATGEIRRQIEAIDVVDETLGFVKLAIKEGQGARDSIEKLAKRETLIREDLGGDPTTLENAWTKIKEFEGEKFNEACAKSYLGIEFSEDIDPEKIELCNRIYGKYWTLAFQLGVVEAFMHIMNTCYPSRTLDKLRTRPAIWIKFMNKAYEKSQIRDVSLDEDHPHSFFKLLKKARGGRSLGLLAFPTFKLYTLELLYLNLEEEVETSTLASIEKTKIKLFIDSARRSLFLKLVEDEKKRLALLKVEADDCEYEDAVTAVAVEARNGMATLWKNVYKDSFDVNKGDWGGPQFTAWAKPE